MNQKSRDICLFEATHSLKEKWKVIILVVFSTLMIFVGCAALIKDEAESRFVIKLATFLETFEDFERPLEPSLSLLERLKSSSNITPQLMLACQLKVGQSLDPQMFKILVRNSFLDVSVRSDSSEGTKQCAEAFIQYIQQKQEPLVRAKTEPLEKKDGELISKISSAIKGKKNRSTLDLETQLTLIDLSINRKLLQRLSPPQLSTPIFTKSIPARPRQVLLIKLGIVIGIGLGLLAVLGSRDIKSSSNEEN
ncbi:MAG: hypothetical protein FJ116_01685 [Deltaproteobacteria bacterium]|nr:hypothetical protein [Deltaproteobacteria bacterium]